MAPAAGMRVPASGVIVQPRKVDVRLPGKGDWNSHGARPVHLIISMIEWIRTSRLSIKCFDFRGGGGGFRIPGSGFRGLCSGSEAGSFLRLIDFCITQL